MAETSRLVPGAPPPPPISKSAAKKKRKAAQVGGTSSGAASPVVVNATLAPSSQVEKAPSVVDAKEGLLAPQITATVSVDAQSAVDDDLGYKPSPVVDLVHKRLKAIHKKIARISTYASTPQEKLNDDQKRTLKTLPGLEAVQKELEEVKKAIEVHEAEQVQELTLKRLEAERIERQKLADAVTAAQASREARVSELLSFLRLPTLLSATHPSTSALELDELENGTIFTTAEILLGDETDHRQTVMSGFLTGEGDYQGVPYTRLHEITRSYLNPPRAPTPAAEEAEEEAEEVATEPEAATPSAPAPGSFHFMQESELEGGSFEENAEWVEKADGAEPEAPSTTIEELAISASGPIDWAEDDGDNLPSIAGLHAKFGTSGTASPAEVASTPQAPVAANGNGAAATGLQEDDDGFTQAGRGNRGRKPHNGFRGDGRGFRGLRGDRGAPRGDRGAPRGDRGGFRGGFRGDGFRGGEGFRGGDRGGPRGRGDGDWRGGGEGRGGEGRGRGRGGRGGLPEPRGAPPS